MSDRVFKEGEGVVADNRLLALVRGQGEAMVRRLIVGFDFLEKQGGLPP
jgi:hypothetical protein